MPTHSEKNSLGAKMSTISCSSKTEDRHWIMVVASCCCTSGAELAQLDTQSVGRRSDVRLGGLHHHAKGRHVVHSGTPNVGDLGGALGEVRDVGHHGVRLIHTTKSTSVHASS